MRVHVHRDGYAGMAEDGLRGFDVHARVVKHRREVVPEYMRRYLVRPHRLAETPPHVPVRGIRHGAAVTRWKKQVRFYGDGYPLH